MICTEECLGFACLHIASAFFSRACDINYIFVLFGVLSFRVVLVVLPRNLSA